MVGGPARIAPSAWFALIVLALANLLNYLDRYILSILAQSIKADLRLDDAQLGFLLGTAFAVFYAVVGIAMGRIADRLSRKRLMAFGLALWSAMTALGGAATNFLWLSVARIGVGVGEATANPCSHALLSQVFPAKRRATALAIYLGGTYIGSALALIVGGLVLENWTVSCGAVPGDFACAIAPWQAALILVGLPGLPLSLLVLKIHEPLRRKQETEGSLQVVGFEMAAALPPFTLVVLHRLGGVRSLLRNLVIAAIATAVATALVLLTGDLAQWAAVMLGAYAVATWAQVQSLRDRPLFVLTFGDPAFMLSLVGAALIACVAGAVSVWAAPYAMRELAMSPVEAGASLGLLHAGGALFGVVLGGLATDRLKQSDRRAPIWVSIVSITAQMPFIVAMMLAESSSAFLLAFTGFAVVSSIWSGAFAALIQDLVLDRMRGAAASAFSLFSIVVASGIGPYWAGKVSAVTGSLQTGLFSVLVLGPVALVILTLALSRVKQASPESRLARAAAAGEVNEVP